MKINLHLDIFDFSIFRPASLQVQPVCVPVISDGKTLIIDMSIKCSFEFAGKILPQMPRLHLCIIILDFIHLPILLFTDSFNYIRNNLIFLYNIFRTYYKSAKLEIVDIFEVLMHGR